MRVRAEDVPTASDSHNNFKLRVDCMRTALPAAMTTAQKSGMQDGRGCNNFYDLYTFHLPSLANL